MLAVTAENAGSASGSLLTAAWLICYPNFQLPHTACLKSRIIHCLAPCSLLEAECLDQHILLKPRNRWNERILKSKVCSQNCIHCFRSSATPVSRNKPCKSGLWQPGSSSWLQRAHLRNILSTRLTLSPTSSQTCNPLKRIFEEQLGGHLSQSCLVLGGPSVKVRLVQALQTNQIPAYAF